MPENARTSDSVISLESGPPVAMTDPENREEVPAPESQDSASSHPTPTGAIVDGPARVEVTCGGCRRGLRVREAALALLRGERCQVFQVPRDDAGEPELEIVIGHDPTEAPQALALVRRALVAGRTLTLDEGTNEDWSESILQAGVRSALCAPIFVRGRRAACFCVTHRQATGLFGPDEERLADFIATIAGAALENAEGFAELRALNETLEQRVMERTSQLMMALMITAHCSSFSRAPTMKKTK